MDCTDFLKLCCSIDLETDQQGKPFKLAAVFDAQTLSENCSTQDKTVFEKLDDFCSKAEYLLGHNILEHDIEVLKNVEPDLKLLSKKIIDTLFCSAITF